MSTKKNAPETHAPNVIYHGDHIPKDLIGQITYSYNWDHVTDPAALKIRNGTADPEQPAEASQIVNE